MPFTISHGAAVLPFRRTRLIWSALLIGSFGPDFQYFLHMVPASRNWHYFPAQLTRCLPFTLFVFFAFQVFVRVPAAGLLPMGLQRRLDLSNPILPRTAMQWLTLIVSLAIGIATHVIWDAITHPFTWPWRHIAFLRMRVQAGPPPHFGYEYAQTFSSIFGLVVLGIVLAMWYRRTPPDHPLKSHLSAWAKVAIIAEMSALSLAGGIWRTWTIVAPLHGMARRMTIPATFVVATMAWFMWLILAYGMYVTFSRRRAAIKTGAQA